MSNDTIEERFAKIESKQAFHDAAIIEHRADAKEIKEILNQIRTSLAVSESRYAESKETPSLEPRVRALEDKANQAFGGWKMIILFAGLGSLILKNLIVWILSNVK